MATVTMGYVKWRVSHYDHLIDISLLSGNIRLGENFNRLSRDSFYQQVSSFFKSACVKFCVQYVTFYTSKARIFLLVDLRTLLL